ncbi:MAG: SGNH/GDSL hydrolase family protein [Pseudomonadota bacterium]
MPGEQSKTKIIIYWILAFIPLLVILEMSSYILLKKTIPTRISGRVGEKNIGFQLAQRKQTSGGQPQIVSDSKTSTNSSGTQIDGLRMFHPLLGWDYPPDITYQDIDNVTYHHGSLGERITCTSYEKTLVSTFGDSFTYCANVQDDCTWQTFLAKKLNQNVLNFGVGGYGTDQAVLKHELQNHVNSKIVMLCILPENINRVVNIYRPFYTYNDPLKLTKPIFVKNREELVLIPNPLKSVDDIDKLDDPEFMMELAKYDYWYQLDQKLPGLLFPWTVSLFRWRDAVLKQIGISLPRTAYTLLKPHYPWNLFDEEYPFSVMCHLVDRFVANASARGSFPIIVIMPHKDYIQESMDYGVNRVARLEEYMTAKNYTFIDAVQLMTNMKPSTSELETMYSGHATARGNEVLAEIIYNHLKNFFL